MVSIFTDFSSPSKLIQTAWPKFNKFPGGNKIFTTLVSKYIPYTGSISPLILTIEHGQVRVFLKDHKAIRNHLNSIHAIALANVGEFSTGLSLISQLPHNMNAILVKIEVEYLKKARGNLISECIFNLQNPIENNQEFKLLSSITNTDHEVVTNVNAIWRVRAKQ
jgi:hypothetical protein